MKRSTFLTATVASLSLAALTPAIAVAAPASATETVVSCGNSGLQSALSTRLCAEITGNTVAFVGKVGLAGPPSPGSPAPTPKELTTTFTATVDGAPLPNVTKFALFNNTNLNVAGLSANVACGSTIRATFGVTSYPWAARPVSHEVTVIC
ncbi:hypothetical protein [Streptomyces melanogenes]|uniref:hypothetical protein n=1 Tax=Streptomyces melanogenes TaxID=67326 RepID=UPI00167CB93D|nr:hypothetical protein [Streptomyces melanogenes]GGP82706.1 hypothetical protein GCM10010278_71710 [Streptomyces melanogenes]